MRSQVLPIPAGLILKEDGGDRAGPCRSVPSFKFCLSPYIALQKAAGLWGYGAAGALTGEAGAASASQGVR